MEAPLLLALARAWLRHRAELPIEAAWASGRALGLQWAGRKGSEGWVFLLQPQPELWLLGTDQPAWKRLQAEAPRDSGKLWGPWLQGARLRAVAGDPRERWLGLTFQRRAINGRLEALQITFQGIPGRAGVRVDGLEGLQLPRLGLGVPFPLAAPVPTDDPPPFRRWRERWGDRLDAALAGEEADIMDGEGELLDRHRAWSVARAEACILGPARAAQERRLAAEAARMARLEEALARDRTRHRTQLEVKPLAQAVSAELYRLRGATGDVTLLDGARVALPEGQTAERAVQGWFAAAKKAERGLARIGELEAELARERAAWERQQAAGPEGLALDPVAARQPRGRNVAKAKGKSNMQASEGKRKDGKGTAFRSVMVDGFEVLIGKGDAENDQLTFKVADNTDFWLHVASVPGSHVVIRNPDKLSELPRTVLERAAELAAYHSKARDGGKVEVHLARIADISKPRGFAPGKVILKKWVGLRVYPKP